MLAALAASVDDIAGRVVEIGAWEGRSTVALANAVAPRIVDCIDTWQGSPGEPSEGLAAGRDVHATWRDNIDRYTAGNVTEHRMGWREFQISDPVALLFIDAEHTFREVYDTIETFRPWLSPGAIVCGDDAHYKPVQSAVLAAFPATPVQRLSTLWIYRHPRTAI